MPVKKWWFSSAEKNRFECGAVGCFKRKMKQETRRCAQCNCGGPDLVCRSLDQQWYWAEHFKTRSEALGHGAAFCSMYIYIYTIHIWYAVYIYYISVYIYIHTHTFQQRLTTWFWRLCFSSSFASNSNRSIECPGLNFRMGGWFDYEVVKLQMFRCFIASAVSFCYPFVSISGI